MADAARSLSQILPATPLLDAAHCGQPFHLKAENLQPIGVFKLRGAWHRLSALDEAARRAGVVGFSSGNHAQGVAWAAARLGIAATIVMPADAPLSKLAATRALGAEVILYERAAGNRGEIAAALAKERGATLVPPYDDPWIIEGQGTVGLEAAAQLCARTGAPPRRFVIPCGGGGLAAGIALAVPDAEIVVVEPEGWDDMRESLRLGRIVPVGADPPPTLCDALQTLRVSPLTFAILRERGAHALAVSEAETAAAVRHAFQALRLVVEPGGAVALAAVLAGRIDVVPGTVVVLSGGNVDPATFSAIIARG